MRSTGCSAPTRNCRRSGTPGACGRKRDPNDPEEIEHNAEIFAIDPQGQIRALYPPNFKPAKLAIGTRTLAQL